MLKKIIFGGIFALFVLGAIYSIYRANTKITGYTKIDSFNEVIDKKETIMVTMGVDTCIHCKNFKKVMDEVAKEHQVNLYYLDANDIDEDHNFSIPLKCADVTNQKLLNGFGTPLTLFIKNGEVVDCISGEVNADVLLSRLRNNEIVK